MRHFSRGMRRMPWRCDGMATRCAVLVLVLQFLMLSACTQRANIVKFSDVDLTDVAIAISMNYQVRKIDIAEQRAAQERDNQLQLVWYTPDLTNVTTVNTNRMHAIASCDGQVYGIRRETPVLDDDFRLSLVALTPDKPVRKTVSVNNENPSFEVHDAPNGVPCAAGRILLLESLISDPDESFIPDDEPGDEPDDEPGGLPPLNATSTFRAVIKWWDVKTGDIQTIPVRYPDGTELGGERIMGFEYDPYCLDQDGRMLVVDSRTGTLRAVDSRTGTILQQIQPALIEKENNGHFYLRATRDYAFLFFNAVSIGSYLPKLFVYRLHDLKPVADITFSPALIQLIDNEPNLHFTEFVPNPAIVF